MSASSASLQVRPAHPWERAVALSIAYRYLPDPVRAGCVAAGLALIEGGEFPPDGVLVAVDSGAVVVGAALVQALPGAIGSIWPPQVDAGTPDPTAVENRLAHAASTWLRAHGVKIAQVLLPPAEVGLADPLLRNGFAHLSQMWYLRREVGEPSSDNPLDLHFQNYVECDRGRFHDTLADTYADTEDCPEINGVRSVEEVLAGYRAGGGYDPARWWLASEAGRPVGVLLLLAVPEFGGWEVAYLGVVPAARRRGVGRALLHQALAAARAARVDQLSLLVDGRNRPALRLYRALGFQPFDCREAFLAIWRD